MSAKFIKVRLPDKATSVPCSSTSTAQEIIIYILSKNMVLPFYQKFCSLLIQDSNQNSALLNPDDLVSYHSQKQFIFMILCLPIDVKLSTLNTNFIDLLDKQVNLYIIGGIWQHNYNTLILAAAFRCAIEFGSFDQQKHKMQFLENQIANFVPYYVIKNKNLQKDLLTAWRSITQQGYCVMPETLQLKYLEFVQSEFQQFGYISTSAILLKINKTNIKLPVFLNISYKSFMISDLQGQSVFLDDTENINIKKAENSTTGYQISHYGVVMEFEGKGITTILQIIDFLRNVQYVESQLMQVEACEEEEQYESEN